MRVIDRPTLFYSLLILLVFSLAPFSPTREAAAKTLGKVPSLPAVPDDPSAQQASIPLFSQVVVEDNPDDDGQGIRIRWLVAESPPAELFSEEQSPEYGAFGPWMIRKTENTVPVCREGEKKKSELFDAGEYAAAPTSGKALTVILFRAEAVDGKAVEAFRLIDQVPVGNSLEKVEFRFHQDSRQVYLPEKKIHYQTSGARMTSNQFWQVYADQSVEYGKAYLYRIAVSDNDQTAYCYQSILDRVSSNRTDYRLSIDFGPVSAELNALWRHKTKFEALKERLAAPIAAPQLVNAMDNPSDSGDAVLVEWLPSDQDLDLAVRSRKAKAAFPNPVAGYVIYRSEIMGNKQGDFRQIGQVGAGLSRTEREEQKFKDVKLKRFIDIDAPGKKWNPEKCEWYKPKYSYIVAARTGDRFAFSTPSGSSGSRTQWLNRNRTSFLILAILISLSILWFIRSIQTGKKLFIRKIAGLDAIDEAIGRATEMGRPILYIPGIMDMNDVQTVAGVIILGRIAKTIAEYDTKLMVPTSRSLVMTTARETVKEAYLSAGRPDAYQDDMITYLTDEQFGYVAGVNGIMVREKPAACFYLGTFFAESLILAETGNSIGAIQIAGTAMPSQLPFFIAACDYTLIGEELFAASAYLSHDPKQLGSLKGQDMGKMIAMATILAGVTLATAAELSGSPALERVFELIRNLFRVA